MKIIVNVENVSDALKFLNTCRLMDRTRLFSIGCYFKGQVIIIKTLNTNIKLIEINNTTYCENLHLSVKKWKDKIKEVFESQ